MPGREIRALSDVFDFSSEESLKTFGDVARHLGEWEKDLAYFLLGVSRRNTLNQAAVLFGVSNEKILSVEKRLTKLLKKRGVPPKGHSHRKTK